MRVAKTDQFQDPKEPQWAAVDELLGQLVKAVNSISFGTPENGAIAENVNGRWVVLVTNAAPNTDTTVRHRLGRAPRMFLAFEVPNATPNAGVVYWGSVAATKDTITVRCTVASKTVALLLLP